MGKRSLIFLLVVSVITGYSQVTKSYLLKPETDYGRFERQISDTAKVPLSNSITDIVLKEHMLYLGTGRGVSRVNTITNQWENYGEEFFNGHGGISALAVENDGTMWVATAFDTVVDNMRFSAGGGLFYLPAGETQWNWIPQPVDEMADTANSHIDLPWITPIQNVTYDIAIHQGELWIASWGGGIRRSADKGKTWTIVTPDGLPFDVLKNLDQRGFALLSENGNIWVGTAEGIAKSEDNGITWEIFKASPAEESVAGNWCIELKYQPSTGWIWAATIKTFAENEYEFTAVCATPDGGKTWKHFLAEELSDGSFPRYIDFIGDTVVVAAENGLYISPDKGEHWNRLGYIFDPISGETIITKTFYSVGVEHFSDGFTCWIGSSDGLISTADFRNFRIIRNSRQIQPDDKEKTFAYPNPFSPRRGEWIRIQFITEQDGEAIVEIFNQAMEKVKELNEFFSGITGYGNRYVLWDGRSSDGKELPNGLYLYKVRFNGKTVWGKILIMD